MDEYSLKTGYWRQATLRPARRHEEDGACRHGVSSKQSSTKSAPTCVNLNVEGDEEQTRRKTKPGSQAGIRRQS
eukprot:429432-Rhodomonas_salina.5